jgi:hypothetical protein
VPTASDAVTHGIRVRVQRCAAAPAAFPQWGLRKSAPGRRTLAGAAGARPAALAAPTLTHHHCPARAPSRPAPASVFVPQQSVPSNRQYFFAYQVTISNEGEAVVMLKSR